MSRAIRSSLEGRTCVTDSVPFLPNPFSPLQSLAWKLACTRLLHPPGFCLRSSVVLLPFGRTQDLVPCFEVALQLAAFTRRGKERRSAAHGRQDLAERHSIQLKRRAPAFSVLGFPLFVTVASCNTYLMQDPRFSVALNNFL